MAPRVVLGPSDAYLPEELLNNITKWHEEYWCKENPLTNYHLLVFGEKVFQAVRDHKNDETLYIHLGYDFDIEGNQKLHRKVDLLAGMAKWAITVMTKDVVGNPTSNNTTDTTKEDIDEAKQHYWALRRFLIDEEIRLGVYQGEDVVTCWLAHDKFYISATDVRWRSPIL